MLPRVILHVETSVDGRMDWLKVDMGLFYELADLWKPDAMLSGSSTMLAAYASQEDPETDEGVLEPPVGEPNDTRQRLVVVDSRGRLRNWNQIRQEPWWRDPVALCSQSTPQSYLVYLQKQHIDYILTGEEQVDLRAALEELNARYGIQVVRVDSGGVLNGALLRAGLVDEVSLLLNPCLVGGTLPRSFYIASDLNAPEGVLQVKLIHVERVQEDVVWLRYQVIQ